MPAKKQVPDVGGELIAWSETPLAQLIDLDPESDTVFAHAMRDVIEAANADELEGSSAFNNSL